MIKESVYHIGDIIKNLTELEISDCDIVSIDAEMLNRLPHLEKLNLMNNRKTRISDNSFANAAKLTRLNLCNIGIQCLTASSLNGLTNLRYLNLSGGCKQLDPKAFYQLYSLEELDLSRVYCLAKMSRLPYFPRH
jgi:Leucine-rich repeat (LRR) protein